MSALTPEPARVVDAARRLDSIANHTPVFQSRTLNERLGAEIFFKAEQFQRVGAFKFRGAYNAISRLSRTQLAAGVVTHSSGNHAQGVALAARLLGVRATIVMPDNAPAAKRAATEEYGASIVTCKAVDREAIAADLVAARGLTLVHPYDDPDIIAGQGTAAYELFGDVGPLDLLLVPVGGGGLISGSALAAALCAPGCRVVGVEPDNAADAGRSWREGRIVRLESVPDTLADGLRTRFIGEHNLAVMSQYVADMVTCAEAAIVDALDFLWTRMKLVVEPSGAVPLAALLSQTVTLPSGSARPRVGVILSGGNISFSPPERQKGQA